jgi:hypothetical protein
MVRRCEGTATGWIEAHALIRSRHTRSGTRAHQAAYLDDDDGDDDDNRAD